METKKAQIWYDQDLGTYNRVSCWIFSTQRLSPLPDDIIAYSASSWDVVTNRFIQNNLNKINDALCTYPGEYCFYELKYVENTIAPTFTGNEDPKTLEQAKKQYTHARDFYHNATSPFEGTLVCALKQDKGREDANIQRLLILNIEDCTQKAILTAIRYIARMADDFKNAILDEDKGFIDPKYYHNMWQIDLKNDLLKVPEADSHKKSSCKDWYEKAEEWLAGDYAMYFTEPVYVFDKGHLMWYDPNDPKSWEDNTRIFENSVQAEALYLFFMMHPEGIPTEQWRGDRKEAFKEEFKKIYRCIDNGNEPATTMFEKMFDNPKEIAQRLGELQSKCKKGITKYLVQKHGTRHIKFIKKVLEYFAVGKNHTVRVNPFLVIKDLPKEIFDEELYNQRLEQACKQSQ